MRFDDILQSDLDVIIQAVNRSKDYNDNYKNAIKQWLKVNIQPIQLVDAKKHFFFSEKAINGMKQKHLNKTVED